MGEESLVIQKNVVSFCKILPSHVEKWRNLVSTSEKPLQALKNYCEQLQSVRRANIKYVECFKDLQAKLLFKICSEIEDEIKLLKDILRELNLVTQDMKNKLVLLEKSTINVNWEENSPLLQGSAFQPPLCKILQEAHSLVTFFSNSYRLMSDHLKNINFNNEESVKELKFVFNVNVMNPIVSGFLAITQYV